MWLGRWPLQVPLGPPFTDQTPSLGEHEGHLREHSIDVPGSPCVVAAAASWPRCLSSSLYVPELTKRRA